MDELVNSLNANVRALDTLSKAMVDVESEIVIHMAAQRLVESFRD